MKWKLELWRKHRVGNTKFVYKKKNIINYQKDESILTRVQHSQNMIINQKKKSWFHIKIDRRLSGKKKEMILTKNKFLQNVWKKIKSQEAQAYNSKNSVVNDLNEFVAKMNLMRYWWTFAFNAISNDPQNEKKSRKMRNKLRARRGKYEIRNLI